MPIVGSSSNGRTLGFGPSYRGSNPWLPAINFFYLKYMDNWSKILIYIVTKLNNHSIPYILIASGSLKVLRVSIKPYDIDILTSEENVRKCFDIFSDIRK